jgi:hypothetical protein
VPNSYQAAPQSVLSVIEAADANNLAAKATDQSGNDTVTRFDASANPSFDSSASGPLAGIDFFVADSSWVAFCVKFGASIADSIINANIRKFLYRFCTADSAFRPFLLFLLFGESITYMLSTLLHNSIPTSSTIHLPKTRGVAVLAWRYRWGVLQRESAVSQPE